MDQQAQLIAKLQEQGYRDRWVAEPDGLLALGANRLVAPEDLVVDQQWGHGRDSLFALRDPVDDLAGFFTSARPYRPLDASMVARLEGDARAIPVAARATPHSDSRDEQIAELKAALTNREDKLRAAVAHYEKGKAEFPAAKLRIEREAKTELDTWKDGFLTGFLEVLDDVDRALDAAQGAAASTAVVEGLELVASRFLAKLREQGVHPIPHGHRFDPNIHEALATAPVSRHEDDGAIIEVISKGYMRDDKVLRPTRVMVGKFDRSSA